MFSIGDNQCVLTQTKNSDLKYDIVLGPKRGTTGEIPRKDWYALHGIDLALVTAK